MFFQVLSLELSRFRSLFLTLTIILTLDQDFMVKVRSWFKVSIMIRIMVRIRSWFKVRIKVRIRVRIMVRVRCWFKGQG